MSFFRASAIVAVVLMLIGLCRPAASDTLVIRNHMRERGTLRIACRTMMEATGWRAVPAGESYTVALPAGAMIDLVPAQCSGTWEEAKRGFPVRFAAYNYFRDHPACNEVCEMEAKDGGWYINDKFINKFYV